MFGTFATMFALWHRDVNGGPGQVIDLAIYEPLFWLLGPQSLVYDQLGYVQNRTGSSTDWTAPRNAYQTQRRQVAGAVGQLPVDRRAGDAARRPPGGRRRALVRATTPAGSSTRTCSTSYIGGWIAAPHRSRR